MTPPAPPGKFLKAPYNAQQRTGPQVVTVTVTHSTAVQWSTGFDVQALNIGLKLFARTGYSTTAATINHWDSPGEFCRVHALPTNDGAPINVER